MKIYLFFDFKMKKNLTNKQLNQRTFHNSINCINFILNGLHIVNKIFVVCFNIANGNIFNLFKKEKELS